MFSFRMMLLVMTVYTQCLKIVIPITDRIIMYVSSIKIVAMMYHLCSIATPFTNKPFLLQVCKPYLLPRLTCIKRMIYTLHVLCITLMCLPFADSIISWLTFAVGGSIFSNGYPPYSINEEQTTTVCCCSSIWQFLVSI